MQQRNRILLMLILLLALMAGPAMAGEVKIALDTPPDLEKSGSYVWAKTLSDHLKANGLSTKIYPRLSLGNEDEKLDQVSQGLLEISCSDLSKVGQINPDIYGFNLPYLFQSVAHLDRVIKNTDFMEKINLATAKQGVRVLALIPAGGFMGLSNSKHRVKTPADMQGLRIRAKNKNQTKFIEAWGAGTVIIPWSEIYTSLQTGVADGYLNSAIVPLMFKHTEVLKYFSDIRYRIILRLGICSEEWFQGLDAKTRDLLGKAVVEADKANRVWQAKVEKKALEDLRAAGVEVYVNTPEEAAQFRAKVQPLYTDVVSEKVAKDFITAAEANK